MKLRNTALAFFLLFCFSISARAQGVISCTGSLVTVSACLHPGQWGEVTTVGMPGLYNYQGGGGTILNEYCVGCGFTPTDYRSPAVDDSILNYMDKGKWNTQTHELYIFGAAHPAGCNSPPTPQPNCEVWFVKFNGDTGQWTQLALSTDYGGYTNPGSNPPGISYGLNNGSHQDDWSALDTLHQNFYCFGFSNHDGDYRVFQYHIPDGTWTTLPRNYTINNVDTLDSQEWFPDQGFGRGTDSGRLVYIVSNSMAPGGVNELVASQYNPGLGQWEYLNGGNFPNLPFSGTQGYGLPSGSNYTISRYDPIHHVLIFGGGAGTYACAPTCTSTSPNQLYAYTIFNDLYQPRPYTCNSANIAPGASAYGVGCTFALPTTGAPAQICFRCGLQEIDPVTGDLIIIVDNHGNGGSGTIIEYRYHYGDAAWNLKLPGGVPLDITSTAAFLTNTPYVTNADDNYPLFNMVTFSIPDDGTYHGMIGFLKHVGPSEVHIYILKVEQRPSPADKCGAPGILNCWTFDSQTNIDKNGQAMRYNWNAGDGVLNADPILSTAMNYPSSGWRFTGEANSRAYSMFDTPDPTQTSIAKIDPTIKFDGPGSLHIPMPRYSTEQTAVFYDNLDGQLGHPNVAICKTLANCPQGTTIWAQAMVYLSDPLLKDFVWQCSIQLNNACLNGSAAQGLQVNDGTNSTADKTLNCSGCNSTQLQGFCVSVGNPSYCTESSVGRRLFVFDGNGSHCTAGVYNIVAVNSVSQVVLDASPSVNGFQCTNGTLVAESVGLGSGGAQPWKLILLVSNALPLPANGNCECQGEVITRGNQGWPAAPIMYDNKGNNTYDPNYQGNFRYLPNSWHEITEEVIVGDSNAYNTEIKIWMDGQLAEDFTQGYLLLDGDDDGYGLGQIQLETYTTKRDPFFQGSGVGDAYWDSVYTSTQPIAFNSNGGGNVVPCSSPSQVVFSSQPSNAAVGASLGTVQVQIQDSAHVLCTTATDSVTLVRAPGTTWGSLTSSSSLTKSAAGGVITWTDLSISPTTGSGSIYAISGSLTTGISNSINITNPGCSSPFKVVFTAQPTSALLGASLGTVTGQIQDASSVPCNTATNAVTLSKDGSATWGNLQTSTSLTKNAVAGIVTWVNELSVGATPGTGSIAAASAGLTGAISTPFNITTTGGPSSLFNRRPGRPGPPLVMDYEDRRRRGAVARALSHFINF